MMGLLNMVWKTLVADFYLTLARNAISIAIVTQKHKSENANLLFRTWLWRGLHNAQKKTQKKHLKSACDAANHSNCNCVSLQHDIGIYMHVVYITDIFDYSHIEVYRLTKAV